MMKNYIYHIAIMASLAAGCAFTSCSDETDVVQPAAEGTLTVEFRTESSPISRATEPGWNSDWNENKVDRLDMFVFASDADDAELVHHYTWTSVDYTDPQTGTYKALSFEGQENPLTYLEVRDNAEYYRYYLIANCESLANFTGTHKDLKDAMISGNLTANVKQTSFVMDSDAELAALNPTAKTATLQFEMSRALAKVRVAVKDASGNDILSRSTMSFRNYATSPTSVLKASEAWGTGTTLSNMENLTASGDRAFLTYPESTPSKAVFYSYPNDWFDTSTVGGESGAWTINLHHSAFPILADKQTYILLQAPYNGTEGYYYKVPVNQALYTNNDKQTYTDEELEEIKALYRMDRNTIYDVTVTIDRAGGSLTDPVTPTFYIRINDWEEGGKFEIGEGEFQGASSSTDTATEGTSTTTEGTTADSSSSSDPDAAA